MEPERRYALDALLDALGRPFGESVSVPDEQLDEVFGLLTNSAVSSTTGAFRYRSAGILLRLGL